MLFKVQRPLQFGTVLHLTGSTAALSKWSVHNALPCKWTEHDEWILHVDPLSDIDPPARFEFKFFARSSSGNVDWEPGENHAVVIPGSTSSSKAVVKVRWGIGGELVLPSATSSLKSASPSLKSANANLSGSLDSSQLFLEASANANGATANDSRSDSIPVRFRMKYNLQGGERLYIAGSIPELGNWNKMHSPQMELVDHHIYELRLQFPRDAAHEAFEYKYFTRRANGSRRWEIGENRLAYPFDYKRAVDGNDIVWDDRWEKMRIEFSIYFPGKEGDVMHITGDIGELGAWYKPGPFPMDLGPLETLETDVEGRKWVFHAWIDPTVEPFNYRYILINPASNFELWEREPNRQAKFEVNNPVPNSAHVFKDVNFVSEMKFDAVPPNMFIGPYPQSVDDVDKLAKSGVTGVFNVQTNEDFEHRGIQWDVIKRRYNDQGIKVVRYPIRDFDRNSLREELNGATHALESMFKLGLKVYIHCTAGMGRAPAVAVAYLCWVRKMELNEAVAHVKSHRTVAVPNIPVIEQALRNSY